MDLRAENDRKYPDSKLLMSSAGRGWSTLYAEVRSHAVGRIRSTVQQNLEIVVAINGAREGFVTRIGAGRRQQTGSTSGTVWLVPIGIGDEEIVVTAPLPQVLHMYLPPQQLNVLADQYNLPRSSIHSIQYIGGIDDELIHQIGLAILTELTHETSTTHMFVETSSLMLAAQLSRRYSGKGVFLEFGENNKKLGNRRLRRVLDYVEQHLSEDITVSDLAGIASLSNFHFTRMFTAAIGTSPHRYVSRRRLENAMSMLAVGKLPLTEIAERSRFSSVASFHRAFRRATGLTPGDYRRLVR